MLESDVEFVANHSISRGIFHKMPERTEWSYALEHDGKVLGIGGMVMITPTVAWCWIDLTHYAAEHITSVYRVIKEWTEILAKDKGIRRAQAYVDCSFPEAIRTAQHLGFVRESVMPNFIDDKPAIMFVRFFQWD